MASFNRIVLMGNLTRDPDCKQLPSGQQVCQLGVASNRQYKNKQTGALVQEVCFVDVNVFGPQADSCRQYLQKGRPVLVEGRLKFDTWESQEGQARSKHSIVADRVVFLSGGQGGQAEGDVEATGDVDTLGKELLKGLDAAPAPKAKRAKAAPASEGKSNNGEFAFQDAPPFQDDLPF